MCTTCGCGATPHDHPHDHDHPHGPRHGAPRRLSLEADVLARNDAFARENRRAFDRRGLVALNVLSSPGAGKTALLAETMRRLHAAGRAVGALVGDQATERDAVRLRASGAPAAQLNTGKGCHLDAHAVGHAAHALGLRDGALLFIENVGNLVCPAGFDLGEHRRVVLLSVTEGEDKPLKYPDAFRTAHLLVLTKCDLLPHLDVDVAQCLAFAREVNPRLPHLSVSARTGEGLGAWLAWLDAAQAAAAPGTSRTGPPA